MRFSKPALLGAALGFVMGIAFAVFALLNYDDTVTTAREVALTSLLIGVPISMMLGLLVGFIWSRVMGPNSL